MKKILASLVLAVLLVGLLAPELVSAQLKRPQECCRIFHKITIETSDAGKLTLKPGDVVQPPATKNPVCDLTGTKFGTKDWGVFCLLNLLYTYTNRIFYAVISFSTIVILMGAYTILFAVGDPEKMKRGRAMIIYAIAGVAIALFAKVIPAIVKFMMGV